MVSRRMITEIEKQILMTMLGGHRPKWRRGYRNRYLASTEGMSHQHLLAMERMGLVFAGKFLSEKNLCWHATESGCRELGFNDDEIALAMEVW